MAVSKVEFGGDVLIDLTGDTVSETTLAKGIIAHNAKGEIINGTLEVDETLFIPKAMRKMMGIYDHEEGHYKLKFLEPEYTVVGGEVFLTVEKVIIRRKLNSDPIDQNDGELVLTVNRDNFGKYYNDFYIDGKLSQNVGDVYYYKAFPMSNVGYYNTSSMNSTDGITCRNYHLFGFEINQNESDPDSMITYLEDNKKFDSAFMNFAGDYFEYGDWEDVWFIRDLDPCVIRYDGTRYTHLNKNNYNLKKSGESIDLTDYGMNGNVMVGIPKTFIKIMIINDNVCQFRFSDKNIDGTYRCLSHLDENGNEIPYCYMSAYDGTHVDQNDSRFNVIRSLSGRKPYSGKNRQFEIENALNNNQGSSKIWYTQVFCDWMLINLLLMLISRSTNSKEKFGTGNSNSYVNASNTGIKASGTLNTKGLFWGSNDGKQCVKVFGIENFWGNIWKSCAGWVNDNGAQKVKLTWWTEDGSSVAGYNTTGEGYIEIHDSEPNGTNGGFISKMKFSEEFGMVPITANGSSSTNYSDGMWFANSQNNYALVGGATTGELRVGAYFSGLHCTASYASWNIGASLSCKPLAQQGE